MARCALVVLALLLPTFAAAKYEPPNDPIAVAIVFNSQDTLSVRDALDRIQIDVDAPFNSRSVVVLVGYDDGARVVTPFVPLRYLTGSAIDRVEVPARRTRTDLVAGVEIAIAELARASFARRTMIVISDGSDTNEELARTRLPELARNAAKLGIRIHWQDITNRPNALDALFRDLRHEPALLPRTKAPHREVPWWWLGFGALIAAAALLFACRSRGAVTA